MLNGTKIFRAQGVEEIRTALKTLSLKREEAIDKKFLKKRYLELVKKNHPDTGGDAEKMKNITTAYELLKNVSHIPDSEGHKGRGMSSNRPQYQKKSSHNSIFDDRGMPSDWINVEILHRMAQRESSFSGSKIHPMFVSNSYSPNSHHFSFRTIFYRALYGYVFIALAAYLILRLLEIADEKHQKNSNKMPISRINETQNTFRRHIEIMEKRKKSTENNNNNYFTVRKDETRNHASGPAFQKIPSSVRGVDYYYPVKGT